MRQMLNFKQIFSKGLILQCRNTFATSRVRNYFEIDPIFPDQNDPDKLLDVKRMPFHDISTKEIKQKNAFIEHTIQEAHKRVPDLDVIKVEAEKQRRKLVSKAQRKDEGIKKIASTILEDPDLGLPYGYGFDDYIQRLKLNRLSSSNDVFLHTLNNLFSKLSASNDLELVEMHRTAIVNKTKDDFKERAKAIVLEHVVKYISEQREKRSSNRRVLRKLIPNEQIIEKAISSPQLTESLIEEIEANIDPQAYENATENLANDAITQTLNLHRDARKKEKKVSIEQEVTEIFKDTFMEGRMFDKTRDMTLLEDIMYFGPRPYPKETVGMSNEEFRRFDLKLEAHDKFILRRDQVIKELYYPPEKPKIKIPSNIGKKRRAELLKKSKIDAESTEIFSLFESLKGHKTIDDLEFQLGIQNTDPKTFKEIYEDLDKVLLNAPLSIKKIISQSAEKGNDTFIPQFTNLSINPNEFFWGNVSEYLKPVLPIRFIKKKKFEDTPAMETILAPATSTDTQKRFRRQPVQENPPDPVGTVQQQIDFDVSELTPEMKREIEIFRQVRREPYFKHYLTNELGFYADRMNDQFALVYAGLTELENRPDDYAKFQKPTLDKIEKVVMKQALLEPIIYNGKSYAGGKRKKAKALAIVKEGTGKIHINRKTFVDYFGTTSIRSLVIEPLLVSGYSVGLDVDFFIWGGGVHAQAEAASLALSKALVKYNPGVKVAMRENGMLNQDPRQTERKHVGKYKARAKFPYSRR